MAAHLRRDRVVFAMAGDLGPLGHLDSNAQASHALGDWSSPFVEAEFHDIVPPRGPRAVVIPLRGAGPVISFGGPRGAFGSMEEADEDSLGGLLCRHFGKAGIPMSSSTWMTRFGRVGQHHMHVGSNELEMGIDVLMKFSARTLISENCSLMARHHLGFWPHPPFMTAMDELTSAEGPMTHLLNMAEHDLPSDVFIPRWHRATPPSEDAIAAALQRCYATSNLSISVVVDPAQVEFARTKLEHHGALVIEVDQLVGRMPDVD
jgi:hypothetical protein